MTVFAETKGGITKSPPLQTVRQPYLSEQIINFGSTTQPNSGFPAFTPNAVTLSGNAAGDTVQAINVPAGFVVTYAGIEVLVADTAGNSGTVQVTDGTNTYTSALTVQTVGIKAFTAAATRLYTTAGILSLLTATGNINATVRVFAVLQDVNAVDTLVNTL